MRNSVYEMKGEYAPGASFPIQYNKNKKSRNLEIGLNAPKNVRMNGIIFRWQFGKNAILFDSNNF
jgi:hypothetical protein